MFYEMRFTINRGGKSMFFSLFGKKKEQSSTETNTQKTDPKKAGVRVQYDPRLIDQLKLEHQALLSIYKEIQESYKVKNTNKLVIDLGRFRTQLTGHLLKENVRFYMYVESLLTQDPTSIQIIQQFRQEMDGIGKAVIDFLDKYRAVNDNPQLMSSFGEDLEKIGSVLAKRILNEEGTLYPLYMPT